MTSKNIAISTHYFVYGAPQALREFLMQERVPEVLFIAHPLETNQDQSFVEIIQGGAIFQTQKLPFRSRFPLLNYLLELFSTLQQVLKRKKKYDLFIGVDSLNALAGILLKKIGKVKRLIYYTIDYVPRRFENRALNALYHWLDSFAVKHADEVWNVSARITEARHEFQGMDPRVYNHQKVVPIGVWYDKLKRPPFAAVKKRQLLFVGNLLRKQGVQYVLEAIPLVIDRLKGFHFMIIGGGPHEAALKKMVDDLKIRPYVTFAGWIKDRQELDRWMSDSALAVAMYDKFDDHGAINFTYYADPTKLKDYLSFGIPILLTEVPHNARELVNYGCAEIITKDPPVIAEAIVRILQDEQRLLNYRKNCLEYIKPFDWNLVFKKALHES